MSCNDNINPCNDSPCGDPCSPTLNDCGCLNPTTFPCITKPGLNLTSIGVTNDMNGAQVLEAINSAVEQLSNRLDDASDSGEISEDVNVKVSANDTTKGYLNSKVTSDTTISRKILNIGMNERLELKVIPANLLSSDADNILGVGSDKKLKITQLESEDDIVYISEGTGVKLTGTGSIDDPIVIAVNESIQVLRPCFDGKWKPLALGTINNTNVVTVGGAPSYRVRFDGTIEFKGTMTFNVQFGPYSTNARKTTVEIGSLSTSCLSSSEQGGVLDLKNATYIDIPQASEDQIVQQYGYTIRKSGSSILLEFQSAFTNATTKTIIVNFDGAISHPNI